MALSGLGKDLSRGLKQWEEDGQLFGDAVSDDHILTNVMISWLTNTAASSARFYYEDAHTCLLTRRLGWLADSGH